MIKVVELAKKLRADGMNVKVAVHFAKALALEEKGETEKADESLAKAIAAEELVG